MGFWKDMARLSSSLAQVKQPLQIKDICDNIRNFATLGLALGICYLGYHSLGLNPYVATTFIKKLLFIFWAPIIIILVLMLINGHQALNMIATLYYEFTRNLVDSEDWESKLFIMSGLIAFWVISVFAIGFGVFEIIIKLKIVVAGV